MIGEKETARGAQTRLRSDALRNRDDILAAAVRAFTKDANASLEGIAKAAGVGIGTLYRHYPTRQALVEAAYRTEIKKLCDEAPELLKKHQPDVALARFLDRFIDDMLTKRGMIEALLAVIAAGGTPLNQSLAMISAAVAPLIEAGKAEGVLRDDVTVDDFITVKGAVVFAGPEKGRRLAAILLDGLRYRPRAPKPRKAAQPKNAKKAALSALAVFLMALGPSACADSDLARAYQTIEAKKFVDLSQAFGPDTPVWSGFGQARFSPEADPTTHEAYTIPKDGFRGTVYEIAGQYGTHVDPPAHFAESGATMDQIPLKQMILPLVVLDDTPYLPRDPNHAFSVEDLRAWEQQHGRVPHGSFVALRTDMYKDWDKDPGRFKRTPFPAWAVETIAFLYEQRGVTATGHESMDTDTTAKMDSEAYILQHGHFQIEVMANLDQVPPTGAVIIVTWPKVRGGLGFPARAFAIVP